MREWTLAKQAAIAAVVVNLYMLFLEVVFYFVVLKILAIDFYMPFGPKI